EGLGWTLFRVWSTDWWKNKADALSQLDQALHEHLAADRDERERSAEQQTEDDDLQGEIDASILDASADRDETSTRYAPSTVTADDSRAADAESGEHVSEMIRVAKLPETSSGYTYYF